MNNGSFSITAVDLEGNALPYGGEGENLVQGGSAYNYTGTVSIPCLIKLDFNAGKIYVHPINSMSVTGNATPTQWDPSNAADLSYSGDGMWTGQVDLSHDDAPKFIFVTNHDWLNGMNVIKHVKDQEWNKIGYEGDYGKDNLDDCSVAKGTYYVTVDMQNMVYSIATQQDIPTEVSILSGVAENGSPLEMYPIAVEGVNKGQFVCYTRLQVGEFTLQAQSKSRASVVYGVSNVTKDGDVVKGQLDSSNAHGYTVTEPMLAMILVDFSNNSIEITPITSMSIVGGFTSGGWEPANGTELEYMGNGVWSGVVDLAVSNTGNPNGTFCMNGKKSGWTYLIKKIRGADGKVGMESQFGGNAVEDVPNPGTGKYKATLNMANHTYSFMIATGVDDVIADGFKVVTTPGRVKIITAVPTEVTVHSVEGRMIWSGNVADEYELALAPGIYIVNRHKVMVR